MKKRKGKRRNVSRIMRSGAGKIKYKLKKKQKNIKKVGRCSK